VISIGLRLHARVIGSIAVNATRLRVNFASGAVHACPPDLRLPPVTRGMAQFGVPRIDATVHKIQYGR